MYRRPFKPAELGRPAPRSRPADSPAIGRHPIPPHRDAAQVVARFVAQAFVLSTVAVVFTIWLRHLWPTGAFLLLGFGSAGLLALAALKWLWGERVNGLPVFTVAVIAGGVLCLLGGMTGTASAGKLIAIAIGVYALFVFASIARAVDSATMWQDWRGTQALGAGTLLLLLVSLIPNTPDAHGIVAACTIWANLIFATVVVMTYVDYVLANPTHPQQTIEAVRARWKRTLWMRDLFKGDISPIAVSGLLALLTLVLMLGGMFGDAPTDPVRAQTPHLYRDLIGVAPADVKYFEWGQYGVITLMIVSYIAVCRKDGRIIWAAIAVWMLYGDRALPAPGIYRPAGWLASVRVRQAIVAVLLFWNVVMAHFTMPEAIFPTVLRGLADPNGNHSAERFALTRYLMMTFTPLLLPFVLLVQIIGKPVQSIHEEIERADPLDLYPADLSGGKR